MLQQRLTLGSSMPPRASPLWHWVRFQPYLPPSAQILLHHQMKEPQQQVVIRVPQQPRHRLRRSKRARQRGTPFESLGLLGRRPPALPPLLVTPVELLEEDRSAPTPPLRSRPDLCPQRKSRAAMQQQKQRRRQPVLDLRMRPHPPLPRHLCAMFASASCLRRQKPFPRKRWLPPPPSQQNPKPTAAIFVASLSGSRRRRRLHLLRAAPLGLLLEARQQI